ncbi:MAG: hypothetical protein KC448_13175 [Yoonia sp.]|nr:hypothetical protein [Yoonia sp.]
MSPTHKLFTVCGILGLAACGGTNTPLSFAEISENGAALADQLQFIPYTDPSTLPTRGGAVYDGYVGMILDDAFAIAGEMEMRVDFGQNGGISGSVYNVVDQTETAYTGELALGNSIIDRGADVATEYTFGVDMTGSLSANGSTSVVDSVLAGDFTGTNHQYVEGIAEGTVTTDGIEQTITDGEFLGER